MDTVLSLTKNYAGKTLENSVYSKISKAAFIILLFFAFFGTAIPFRPRIEDVDQISSSNIINQVLYSVLFLVSIITLIPKKDELFTVVKTEKFLFLFMGYALLSMAWSDYSFVTFKRIFQIITIVLTSVSFLLYADSTDDILKHFKYIVYLYLFLSIIVVFIIPGAKDPQFHTWRGFTSHKNTLGQISLISTILCYIFYKSADSLNKKSIALFMMFIAIALLFGAYSSTSILTFLFFIGMLLLLSLDYIFKPIGIGRTFSITTAVIFFILILGVMIFLPQFEKLVPALFGKDTTFSGRTDLWEYLLNEIKLHPVIGTGYQAYWVPDNRNLLILYKSFVWLPNQAHNGYLDILLQNGIIGLALVIMMLFNYFINFIKIHKPHPWVWFVVVSLITNFQESTLLRPGQMMDFMFLFAYVMLFVNRYRNFVWERYSAE